MEKKYNDEELKRMAKMMALVCVRNTVLEQHHSGVSPSSKTGDYSDVKVVTPYGEIPWNEVSRINDDEIKIFNKEVVNKIYTYLKFSNGGIKKKEQERFFAICAMFFPHGWDDPEDDEDFVKSLGTTK